MKRINKRPKDYELINNLSLRTLFEDSEEPFIGNFFKSCGLINKYDESYAIDMYDNEGIVVLDSYLYESDLEYEQDCKILRIWKS